METDKNFEDLLKSRLETYTPFLKELFLSLYSSHPKYTQYYDELLDTLKHSFNNRGKALLERDIQKNNKWFLSNEITGMSLYVDRFAKNIKGLEHKLDYLNKLGVNLLHLMPLMESPPNESDGGYAVSNFRKVNPAYGTIEDLISLQKSMQENNMYLVLDIVLNHTSHNHEWALKAKAGEKKYQDYYFCFDDRVLPDQYEQSMPEVFPESHPGNFSFVPDINKWVMTVFHSYQWDLNFRNPVVFIEMLKVILFYANMGVDILRIDAPAFIWKEIGTTCQNLPKAHTLLKLIKQCVQIAAPGMALLAEAIVAPSEIIKYFGEGNTNNECDLAYNATQMAVQWDALATTDTRIMQAAQQQISRKPRGVTWINYTRCHDDIGLGYEDSMIEQAGYSPFDHRKFLQEFYSGKHPYSSATGALFSVNPKTQDARISGTLASLCGLERAQNTDNITQISKAIDRIILMQATSILQGGIPMLFYGDEVGYTNDYSSHQDDGKSYDNRWMHRPIINWNKNSLKDKTGTIENNIFEATRSLIELRRKNSVFADNNDIIWLNLSSPHLAAFVRHNWKKSLTCIFNYGPNEEFIFWDNLPHFLNSKNVFEHWGKKQYEVKKGNDFSLRPYQFIVLEEI